MGGGEHGDLGCVVFVCASGLVFLASIYEQQRLFPGGVLMLSPVYFRFLHVRWFCPDAHKHRVKVGWKLEVLAGEQGAAET